MQGDETISRIRAIVQEQDKLKRQLARLEEEMRSLLQLDLGSRKPARKTLSKEDSAALVERVIRRNHERISTV